MRHLIKSKASIDIHTIVVKVELLADNNLEERALKNIQIMTASTTEKELIENYLHFNLDIGNYSVLKSLIKKDNIFYLKVFIEP